jgi:hypothetical protein
MQQGDFTLHYANGHFRGVGMVLGPSRRVVRPPEWTYEGRAGDLGRQVQVKYQAVEQPLPHDAIPLERRIASDGGGAFDVDGKVKRGYLFALDPDLALDVLDMLGLVASADELDDLYGPADDQAREFVFVRATETTVVVKARGEQGALRRFLFGARTNDRCGLCGEHLPVSLLHTAHIRKRSKCSDGEKRDGNVGMAACLLGCDALFELGLIGVAPDGRILVAPGAPQRAAQRLVGATAPAHRAETELYFGWHREHSFRP